MFSVPSASGKHVNVPAFIPIDPSTGLYVPPAAPAAASSTAAQSGYATSRRSYLVVVAGPGYAVGDQLDRIVTTNASTGAIVASYWLNVTTGAQISGYPSSANIAINSGQANLVSVTGSVSNAALGNPTDPAATTTDATAQSLVALAKALLASNQGSIPAGSIATIIGSVGGAQSVGAALTGGGNWNCLLDATSVCRAATGNAAGAYVQGPGGAGSAAVGNPLRLGVTDASGNTQSLKGDSSGYLYALPYGNAALAPPAAVASNAKVPLWLGGYGETITGYSDGAIDYYARGNASGAFMQGAAASGAPVAGNPVPMGFSDGASAQRVKGDPANGATFVEEATRTAYVSETTTALAASATFTSTARDIGGTIAGSPSKWGSFGCMVRADQAGTATLSASNDNATFFTILSQSINALTTYTLTSPIFMRFWKCSVTNGSTAQGYLFVNTRAGN
jgi:hypothetical protein